MGDVINQESTLKDVAIRANIKHTKKERVGMAQTLVLRIIDQIRKVDLHHLPHEPAAHNEATNEAM